MSDKQQGQGLVTAKEWLDRNRPQTQEKPAERDGQEAAEKKEVEPEPVRPATAKFGAGHVSAMGRLGLKELRNAFNPSKESVADTEMGLYGTLTQGEVADSRAPEIGPPKSPSDAEVEPTPEATPEAAREMPPPEPTSPEVAAELARMRGNEMTRSRGR
jgi:hypothetical protein